VRGLENLARVRELCGWKLHPPAGGLNFFYLFFKKKVKEKELKNRSFRKVLFHYLGIYPGQAITLTNL
jgi:hypothetical protein